MKALRSFAADGPVPLFTVVGEGAGNSVDELSLSPWIKRVVSPRHASILLVAGRFRHADGVAIKRVHDQMSRPRATVTWGAGKVGLGGGTIVVDAEADPLPTLRDAYRRLLTGTLPSEPPLLPDAPPAPWRGVGEHGQGGEGMMGGTPYGRPMTMTGDDLRDGLSLDRHTVQVGPFLPALPSGLVLEMTLQGDVIQEARVIRPPFARHDRFNASADAVSRRRARSLRSIARLLALLELHPQSESCLRVAGSIDRGNVSVSDDWRRGLHRGAVLRSIPPGLGRIDGAVATSLGGIALTARERLAAWFDEAESTSQATAAAGFAHVERPAIPSDDSGRIPCALTDLLIGLEWSEALIVIASFDADAVCLMSPLPDPSSQGDDLPAPARHAMHSASHTS